MLCWMGSRDLFACVDGELVAFVRRLLSDFVIDEMVPGSHEVRILLKAWRVDELPLRPINGCAVVEHHERFFVALNETTKTQFFTALMSLVRDVVLGVGAMIVTRLSSSVMLYPLLPQMIQDCSAERLTEDVFRWTSTLVNHGVLTEFESRRVPEQYAAGVKILWKRCGAGSKVEIVTILVRLWLGFDKWRNFPDLLQVVEVLLLTIGRGSYTFDCSDTVAGVMNMNESSSVLHCVRSWFSHEGRSSCAETTATVVRASQEAMFAGAKSIVDVVGGVC